MVANGYPDVVDRFSKLRSRKDLTLDEVVEQSDAVLRDVAPRQTRYAVADRPDVRTIRYYTSRGLLPKPLSYDGGRARYGFAHLVRLLAIKRMQAQHMSLEQIGGALEASSTEQLEAMLGSTVAAPVAAAAQGVASADAPSRPRFLGARDDVTVGRSRPRDLELELAPGGKVLVPAAVVGNSEARRQLADNLEALARLLRAMGERGGRDG